MGIATEAHAGISTHWCVRCWTSASDWPSPWVAVQKDTPSGKSSSILLRKKQGRRRLSHLVSCWFALVLHTNPGLATLNSCLCTHVVVEFLKKSAGTESVSMARHVEPNPPGRVAWRRREHKGMGQTHSAPMADALRFRQMVWCHVHAWMDGYKGPNGIHTHTSHLGLTIGGRGLSRRS